MASLLTMQGAAPLLRTLAQMTQLSSLNEGGKKVILVRQETSPEDIAGMVASSGIAVVSLILHALPKGSTILCGDDVYGGTYRLLTTVFQDIHDIHFEGAG